jgi:Hydrogenase maturation factor|uniref:Acylphosphatase-like domain-containing protein n=1 Tax=Ignisphaera aggregans TaxID=334771 RepID=A0A7J3Z6I4_9CREN
MSKSDVRTYLIIVRGVLRGFGIRGYAYEKMMLKGLRGFIEDLDSNELLLCVSGPETSLNEFIVELKNALPFVIISDIEVYEFEGCLHQGDEDISLIVKDFE